MNTLRNYVAKLSRERLWEIHTSYTQFEKDGFIGDEACRMEAKNFLASIGVSEEHIVLWMTQITFEAYRRLALEPEAIPV